MKKLKVQPWALFVPEIKSYINSKDLSTLKTWLKDIHPMDIAECIIHLEANEKVILFELLPKNRKVEVFEELPYADQELIMNALKSESISEILDAMEIPRSRKLFSKLPKRLKQKMLATMKKSRFQIIEKTMDYRPNTVGAVMHTDFISLTQGQTIKEALETIQNLARLHKAESMYAFYVVDKSNVLIGGISFRKLLSAPPDMKLYELVTKTTLIELSPYDDIGHAINMFKKYDLVIAPVVDGERHLIGVVLIDDIMDVSFSTALAQLHGLGKMATRTEIRYSDISSPLVLVKNRIPWLIVLVILGYIGSEIIKLYEHALATVVALAFFIPMLCDTGGNAGCQTTTTLVRSIATGDINRRTFWKAIFFEILSALVMGIIVGIVGAVRALVMVRGDYVLSFVVGLSVCCVVILAACTGVFLPFIARLFRIDPAVFSAPLVTTVVDVVGLLAYFKIASLFLPVLKQL